MCGWWTSALAESLRIATYNTELQRDGPGLLYRDLLKGSDPQINAVIAVIAKADADILLIQGFDYDLDNRALAAFAELAGYSHFYASRPNTGIVTDHDMDLDGRLRGPRDAQSYGEFAGQAGMALLSRFPIRANDAHDFSDLLWKDLPDALLPVHGGQPFPSPEALAIQRLSNIGHWVLPVEVPALGQLHVLGFHATPPVFDGPEDRNGKRNHDEIRFWSLYLDGHFDGAVPERFVVLGDANNDPEQGEGIKDAINGLLNDPRLQDPKPLGAAGTATVDWTDIDVGKYRVDYVLPSADLSVKDSGVLWPAPGAAFAETVETASRHRVVWVDIDIPD
ncbi:MAG: endonuclease/exonuclease/phosphatase family protein [Pseudomonadota bacterium]